MPRVRVKVGLIDFQSRSRASGRSANRALPALPASATLNDVAETALRAKSRIRSVCRHRTRSSLKLPRPAGISGYRLAPFGASATFDTRDASEAHFKCACTRLPDTSHLHPGPGRPFRPSKTSRGALAAGAEPPSLHCRMRPPSGRDSQTLRVHGFRGRALRSRRCDARCAQRTREIVKSVLQKRFKATDFAISYKYE